MLRCIVGVALAVLAHSATSVRAAEPNRIGTGFAVADGTWIVTANHIIAGKPCIVVGDGASARVGAGSSGQAPPIRWEAARLVAANAQQDLALLRVATARPPLSIARWDHVPTGIETYVLGYPQPAELGLSLKIARGLLNGVADRGKGLALFILDAPIQLGNSGGPVLSPDGLVVGMVRARIEPGAFGKGPDNAPQLVNFAVNASAVVKFLEDAALAPRVVSPDLAATQQPYAIYREAARSVVMVAAGAWKGQQHPVIAGQRQETPLVEACSVH
jgi:S1-C subfamily serine protease